MTVKTLVGLDYVVFDWLKINVLTQNIKITKYYIYNKV